jgi:hypothetical protein
MPLFRFLDYFDPVFKGTLLVCGRKTKKPGNNVFSGESLKSRRDYRIAVSLVARPLFLCLTNFGL